MSDTPAPNVFSQLRALSGRTKLLTLADPQDIEREEPKWSPEQERQPLADRGRPAHGFQLHIKPGAATFQLTVRRLTAAQREACDRVLETLIPPEIVVEQASATRGEPPQRVRTGYEWDEPGYLAGLAKLEARQRALVALHGVEGLHAATAGETDDEKITALRGSLDDMLLKYLASEIWNLTYSAGNPEDFFTSANS